VDKNGDDHYFAGGKYIDYDHYPDHFVSMAQGFSIGARPFAPGGLAVLYDQAGNDDYRADVFGQGCAYWYGVGMLLDGGGDDRYHLCEYGQGSGIHLAVGILVDHDGNESYTADKGLAQAGSHDFAVGFLWDLQGDDHYEAESGSQGSGINNAVGILLDESGNDRYVLKNPANPYGQGTGGMSPRRGIGSVGLLCDLGGEDLYTRKPFARRDSNARLGAIVHVKSEEGLSVVTHASIASYVPHRPMWRRAWDEIKNSYGKIWAWAFPDSSFWFSRAWNNQAEKNKNLSVDLVSEIELIQRGGNPQWGQLLDAVNLYGDSPWKVVLRETALKSFFEINNTNFWSLIPYTARSESMNRVMIEEWIKKQNTNEILPEIRRLSASKFWEEQSLAVYFLGEWGTREDALLILPSLKNKRLRAGALLALSKMPGSEEVAKKVKPFLKSERGLERALAVKILSKNNIVSAESFFPFLDDVDFNVRLEAVSALQNRNRSANVPLGSLGTYYNTLIKVEP
jgi:hypothetical protein